MTGGIMRTSLHKSAGPERPLRRASRKRQPIVPAADRHPRRRFLRLAAGAVALPAASRIARAQSFPTRPITMIVPFPAGGSVDAIGRIVVERMRGPLGQRIVIENVGGADGSIGVGRAARARPDGYTICLSIMDAFVLNGAYYSLPYDVLNDFAPISLLATLPTVLAATRTMPANDLGELIAWLRAHPNQVSAGMNTLGFRLLAELFQKQTGTQFTIVPYRAAGTQLQDLIAGRIELTFGTTGAVLLPQVKAGSVKTYAVASETRAALLPDIPTFAELGLPEITSSEWFGIFVPKGTPKDIIGKLNAAAIEALADATVRSRLADLGFEVFPRDRQTPEALAGMQRAGADKWWPIIKELGLKAE
jgi:tripartite-type tricarboxylate transporter receptor subunit TctC